MLQRFARTQIQTGGYGSPNAGCNGFIRHFKV
jgi:hypothetical protein